MTQAQMTAQMSHVQKNQAQLIETETMSRDQAQDLADRYAAAWNEADAAARRRAIAQLWVPDGQHYVGTRQARGYEALEQRIIGSYEKSVRDRGNRFRAVKGARALRDTVTFFWEMLPAHGETVLATGLEFLIVDREGRILVDYQFVLDQMPNAR